MNDSADYPHRRKTSDQKQQEEVDPTIEQLRLTQQQLTGNSQPHQLQEQKPDPETDKQANHQETNKHLNSPKLGREFGHLPASYYLEAASEQIPGLGEKGKNITPAGLAAFRRLGIDPTKSEPAPQSPTLDSRLAAIRAQRDSLSTPPTPEQPSSPDAETHQERVDPSKMTLDQRIAHNRANSATPEQSRQINQDLNR